MPNKSIDFLREKLPLKVTEVYLGDPVFSLSGPNWNFHSINPWRVLFDDSIYASVDSFGEESVAERIENHNIYEIRIDVRRNLRDIKIFIDSNVSVEIFDLGVGEGWVFKYDTVFIIT